MYNIQAEQLHLGIGVVIDENAIIRGPNGPAKTIYIGDHTYIGASVQIICDHFHIGDYSKIHHHTVIHGYQPCRIGHNAWIGPYCMLDSIGTLNIEDNFVTAAQSQFWTHITFGDDLEGCNYLRSSPMNIGKDVYFAGNCKVASIQAADKSMALMGAVVTKDMAYNRVYAGFPAIDVTEKFGVPYRTVSVEEKYTKLIHHLNQSGISNTTLKIVHTIEEFKEDGNTYFAVATRQYLKRSTPEEIAFIRYLLPAKAKFTPINPFV